MVYLVRYQWDLFQQLHSNINHCSPFGRLACGLSETCCLLEAVIKYLRVFPDLGNFGLPGWNCYEDNFIQDISFNCFCPARENRQRQTVGKFFRNRSVSW